MYVNVACKALAEGHRLAVECDGTRQVVEVHAVGLSISGNEALLGFIVRNEKGMITGTDAPGWRFLTFDKVEKIDELDELSLAPRREFHRDDARFVRIYRQM